MKERIVEQLKQFLIHDLFVELPKEQIGLEDGLQSKIGLDSIGFVEMRILCERQFNIEINDDEYSPKNFHSLNALSELIERKLAAKGGILGS